MKFQINFIERKNLFDQLKRIKPIKFEFKLLCCITLFRRFVPNAEWSLNQKSVKQVFLTIREKCCTIIKCMNMRNNQAIYLTII